ncbi:MAG: ribonuclease HII [Bacilli bacterium]|nr:ribonuclease HII [Bacilli bacterium]
MANREYETQLMNLGCTTIVGTDEAGRGPIAGPLVVAAVVLPNDYVNVSINDSKKLTDKKRRELYSEIIKVALDYSVVIVSLEDIDRLNIYMASKEGMIRAINNLKINYDGILTDAMPIKGYNCPILPLIKGDEKSISIAAASILAKVTRDNIMLELDKKYPLYDFKNNKGYATKNHIKALEKYGVCEEHRKTFEPIFSIIKPKLDLT